MDAAEAVTGASERKGGGAPDGVGPTLGVDALLVTADADAEGPDAVLPSSVSRADEVGNPLICCVPCAAAVGDVGRERSAGSMGT